MKIKAIFLQDHSLAVALIALVCWLIPSSVWASVEIDGIYYELNTSSKTAEVVSSPDYYSGTINIPANFVYQGSTYSVIRIGSGTFCDCTGLTSVDIPNNVTSIDDDAFSSCTGLTSVVIPNGVTRIGLGTFNGCSSLTSVTIPNSVTIIDDGAFAYLLLQGAQLAWASESIVFGSAFVSIYGKASSCALFLTSRNLDNFLCLSELSNGRCSCSVYT